MENIAGILFLATLIEGLITYLFGDSDSARVLNPRRWLQYVSLGLGVVAAVAYQIDLPGMVGLTAVYPAINWVVSGIIIGRGSNYLNDLVSMFRKV